MWEKMKKFKRNTKFYEEIKEISTKIQDVIKEIDNIKKVSQMLTEEIRKTLVISYM